MQALGNFGQLDELAAQAEAVLTFRRARQRDALRQIEVARVAPTLELLGEGGYRCGEAQVLAGSRNRLGLAACDRPLQQPAGELQRPVTKAQQR